MQQALEQFRENMARVRDLGAMYLILSNQTMPVVDISDLLRAELVLALSAFDHYIHEITRIGMQEAYLGQRNQTSAFSRFNVSMEGVLQGVTDLSKSEWLDHEIRVRHSWLSFQRPDKIADAIRLISEARLWDEVATEMGMTPKGVKQELQSIVDRRNTIAHEADIDPTSPDRSRWPINEAMVNRAIVFLEQVAEAIARVVGEP